MVDGLASSVGEEDTLLTHVSRATFPAMEEKTDMLAFIVQQLAQLTQQTAQHSEQMAQQAQQTEDSRGCKANPAECDAGDVQSGPVVH